MRPAPPYSRTLWRERFGGILLPYEARTLESGRFGQAGFEGSTGKSSAEQRERFRVPLFSNGRWRNARRAQASEEGAVERIVQAQLSMVQEVDSLENARLKCATQMRNYRTLKTASDRDARVTRTSPSAIWAVVPPKSACNSRGAPSSEVPATGICRLRAVTALL
jgi:hypothetical protein